MRDSHFPAITHLTSLLLIAVFISQSLSGCAVVAALKQPSKKNIEVLNNGTSRENVIVYLGAPITSEKENGKRTDIYKFVQGYGGGTKASRALMHGILDALTIFIWELIGWPMETIINGHEMTVKVIYDQDDRVEEFTILKE